MSNPYLELLAATRRSATLSAVEQLLNWDQETYMPHNGADFRAEEQSLLAELTHQMRTNKRTGELLAACEADSKLAGDENAKANLREMRRDYDRATKLPTELVSELALVGSQSQEVWKQARAKNDFKMFEPWLEKMFALTRRKAECYGWAKGGEPYDGLKGGAWLSAGGDGAVVGAGAPVSAADHGADGAGGGFEDDHGPLPYSSPWPGRGAGAV